MGTDSDKKVQINSLRVSYIDEGPVKAPVILFLHGFPLNKSMWQPQIAALRGDYRTLAYDVRGHGHSEMGAEDFSIALFAKDLIAFMDTLQVEKAIVCGLSMGGYIALNAVLHFPKRFAGLVLCDTNCVADSPQAVENRMKGIESIKTKGVAQYADEGIKNLFAPESFSTKSKEIAEVRQMITATDTASLVRTLHALAKREETCGQLARIALPTLILVGEEDKITPRAMAEVIQRGIEGSTMNLLPHAGHLSNMENPEHFNTHLKAFVSKVYDPENERNISI